MWIKPGQHGTSARHPPGLAPLPHQRAPPRGHLRTQVRTQRWTATSPIATRGTGTLATRGRPAHERLSLGRTCSAL